VSLSDFLYSLGEGVERSMGRVATAIRDFLFPSPRKEPPKYPLSGRVVNKRKLTVHELLSLHLQLVFLAYLTFGAVSLFLPFGPYIFVAVSVVYFLHLRALFRKYCDFLLDPGPYRFFYFGVSSVAFVAFAGFFALRALRPGVYYYYAYVVAVMVAVLAFRWYFKYKFGRDYTHGIVEEVQGDLVKVFINDDISANVKPGHYWVPAVPDAEPGRVVKVLLEERFMKGAVPVRILEVYLSQSSHTETEPKDESE